MREIKFRAWYPRNHKFNVCNTHIDGTGLLFWQFGYNCDVIEKEERDEVVIQFYTGLKDKNGKEIYEGDILNIGEVGYAKAELVVFDKGCFGINASWITYKSEDPFMELNRYCNIVFLGCVEVIGNIMENPELSIKAE